MSLLGRLLHLTRVELQTRLGGRFPPFSRSRKGGARKDPGYDPGAADSRSQHRHRDAPQPDRDPVLAGYYANLELPYGADLEAVRNAWKRLVRQYHPDLHSADAQKKQVANELVQGLNRAYEELSRHLEQQR